MVDNNKAIMWEEAWLVGSFFRYRFVLVIIDNRYTRGDGYYVAYKPITLPCMLFMFIEMKFIHYHSCVMFTMKSMSICND